MVAASSSVCTATESRLRLALAVMVRVGSFRSGRPAYLGLALKPAFFNTEDGGGLFERVYGDRIQTPVGIGGHGPGCFLPVRPPGVTVGGGVMGWAIPLARERVTVRRASAGRSPLAVPASVSRPVTSCSGRPDQA